MAAVTSNQPIAGEGLGGHENDHLAEPRPSFTAVNGSTSPLPPSKPRSDQEPQKELNEATTHRSILPNHQHEAPQSPAQSRQDRSANGTEPVRQERRLSPAPASVAPQTQSQTQPSNQPQNQPHPQAPINPQGPTPGPIYSHPSDRPPSTPSQRPETSSEPRGQYPNHSRTPSNQQSNGVMSPQVQKRKRSFDGEHQRRPEFDHQAAYPMNGAPLSPNGPRTHNMDDGPSRERPVYSPRQTYPPPPETYPPPPPDAYHGAPQMRESPPDIYPRPERHQHMRNDYDHPVDPSIAPGQSRTYYSDQQMADSLRQHNRSYDSMPPREAYGTPEDDDEHGQYGDYGANRSSVDLERKRRKRVFSNRTKTGCMTCRRRKKKCDEQHPECKSNSEISARIEIRYSQLQQVITACEGGLFAKDIP